MAEGEGLFDSALVLRSQELPSVPWLLGREGRREPVDLEKIHQRIASLARDLVDVDPLRVALPTIGGMRPGMNVRELDELAIHNAAMLIVEDPEYGVLAARMLARLIAEDLAALGVRRFSEAVDLGHRLGLIHDRLRGFVFSHAEALDALADPEADGVFSYFGLKTVYDRYLLRHPELRVPIEGPQHFFLRIACALAEDLEEAARLYRAFSRLEYLPSSPTLFNAGTQHEQMSSCFLLDSPEDSLSGIYQRYTEIAKLSKFSGGIGIPFTRVRARGSLIRGTNGRSSGIVPWLKTLDCSVAAVNQGGRRKGACCVYLETWHADIEEFLELRDNVGDEMRRTHHLNIAHWIPDLFMRRVEADEPWSLFDPKDVPQLPDLYGEAFEQAYRQAEARGLARKVLPARELYGRMMRTLAETGNGWICFKDRANALCNQTALPGRVVHSSNLCTEILEITSEEETAVCNLGSINLARHCDEQGRFDFAKLAQTVRLAVRQLDRVIDLNFYPIESARRANLRWRPIGLGVMGLQDVFFRLRLPFDSEEALRLARRIAEEVYYHALDTSCDLAIEKGPHPAFPETRAARGALHHELWGARPEYPERFEHLKARIAAHGLRNSLLIAIAPTATIASIAGCYESVEPQLSNLFKRETLSGEFLQINAYLVAELKRLGLWTAAMRERIILAEGSIQGIEQIPEILRRVYRTAWELPMRALIDLAAARGPFVDQGQSLNLFMARPTIGALSSMYMYAWKQGLKTTYYLRSRPASSIAKATVSAQAAVSCSLAQPETCEACQ